MDLFPLTPNLDALLGRRVSVLLMREAGGLQGLAVLNGLKIRLLGLEAKKAEAKALLQQQQGGAAADKALDETQLKYQQLAKEAEKVIGGHIVEAPLLDELFDGDLVEAIQNDQAAVRKAVDVLGNKCALAAKTDLSGSRKDGGHGKDLIADIKAAVVLAREKGKVDAGHVKALDAVETREDKKKQRGGKQARATEKRQRTEAEDGLDAETIVLQEHLKVYSVEDMGLTREEREEKLLKRDDVRREILVKQEQMRRAKEQKEQKALQQSIDLRGGPDEAFFRASGGYLAAQFGRCRIRYDKCNDLYAHVGSLLK